MRNIQLNRIEDIDNFENEKIFYQYFDKALICQSNDQIPQAIDYYQKALLINSDHLASHQVLAYLLQQSAQYATALDHYKQAIKLHNHSATLQNSAGICSEHCNQLQQAKQFYQIAASLKQDNAEALNNLGNVCRKLGEYDDAENYLFDALRLNISVATLANLGLLMVETCKYSLAQSFYDHALRLEPDNAEVQWNKSLLLLSQGKFKAGWPLYDQGKYAQTRPKQIGPHLNKSDAYDIEIFRNKSIYIRGEQGIGDEIMFASCFSEIIDVANKCTIECDDRLLPLFQRSFKKASILPAYDALINQTPAEANNCDIVISSASLTRFLRHSFTDFPSRKEYLKPFKRATGMWRKRYYKLGEGLKVGISWRGGTPNDTRRRSTNLSQWQTLLNTPDAHFINLQYGDCATELDNYKNIHEWPDTNHFHNIEQLATQIAALDLIITVSNVTAHLAGAMGVPVLVLLPYSPNWRWFNGKNPSPWYESATLFQQSSADDWQEVFGKIALELRSIAEQNLAEREAIIS